MKRIPYQDLHALSEDQRIEKIAEMVRLGKKTGAFVDNEPGKADRYIAKVQAKFPGVDLTVVRRDGSPTPKTTTLIFSLPATS